MAQGNAACTDIMAKFHHKLMQTRWEKVFGNKEEHWFWGMCVKADLTHQDTPRCFLHVQPLNFSNLFSLNKRRSRSRSRSGGKGHSRDRHHVSSHVEKSPPATPVVSQVLKPM